VADLPIPELVENQRRSIAMLPVGAPALNRDEALELFEQLTAALRELRKLATSGDTWVTNPVSRSSVCSRRRRCRPSGQLPGNP
jgi:hypothetical protein